MSSKFAQLVGTQLCPIQTNSLKEQPKTFKILPKWRNFAKSGPTALNSLLHWSHSLIFSIYLTSIETHSLSLSHSHILSQSFSRHLAISLSTLLNFFNYLAKDIFLAYLVALGGGQSQPKLSPNSPRPGPPFPGIQSICSKIIATPEYNSIPRLINDCCRCCL